jgi:signal transduction histidine kinase/Pyruvate/2-oxoacid:ferredoxin oxidoreductase delta subunit
VIAVIGRVNAEPLVRTRGERCRVCYTCVRECPAKAIRIRDGQAEVIAERCIGCGNCVRVCSQNAKDVRSSVQAVDTLLKGPEPVAICLAPSFPAEFVDADYRQLVGMLRAFGFAYVVEVAFGADLVARAYRNLFRESDGKRYISTTCPAIVSYIEKYHPSLVKFLAPVASPMIATARAVRRRYGSNVRIVFVGPCLAKKGEALRDGLADDVDEVLTFEELRRMFAAYGIESSSVQPSDFDGPQAGTGGLFAVGRGILQAAGLSEDLIRNDIVTADGTKHFVEAIREFEEDGIDVKLLEVLCCSGCIMGSGMTSEQALFGRRACVSRYVRERYGAADFEKLAEEMDRYEYLDLSVRFSPSDLRLPVPSRDELERILQRMGKRRSEDELNCGACGYETCLEHAIAIHRGLAENEMCLPYTIEKLRETADKLSLSCQELEEAQHALVQSEKLASMGQLAAGIAHEVNNPLGVVLLFAHMLREKSETDSQERHDLDLIVEQAERCKKIVGGLLNFARKNKLCKKPVDVNAFLRKCFSAVVVPDNVRMREHAAEGSALANLDPDQMMQVMVNLLTNAAEAMPHGGMIDVSAERFVDEVRFVVEDSGVGIGEENLGLIFEPFFTTKQIGKGTGLGLSVVYGIVKMHRGRIDVQSNADPAKGPTGTRFTVIIPLSAASAEGDDAIEEE